MRNQQLNVTVCNKGFALQLTQNCSNEETKEKTENRKQKKKLNKRKSDLCRHSRNESLVLSILFKPCLQKVIPVFFLINFLQEPKSSDNSFRLGMLNLFTFSLPKQHKRHSYQAREGHRHSCS